MRAIAAGQSDDGRRRVGSETMDGQVGAKALLAADGYTPVRYFAVSGTALHVAMKSDSAIARAVDRGIHRSLEDKLIRMNLIAAGKS